MIRTLCSIVLLYAGLPVCSAQTFGGTGPAIKWRQIQAREFRIIYPQGIDSVANRIAANIRYLAPSTLPTIGSKTKKVNIVLRNAGLVSNGYVSLAPFRSEFYLTPPQNAFELGSTPWPDLLSAHEYRHVQQYNNFDVGLSRALKTIFGQEGQALGNSASVPDWFFEGDAVYNETNVTGQGRGSLPYFYNGYRALWRDGKNYRWMKLRNGSYLDFVPDKYILGFMITEYGREKYGINFWKNVTRDAAGFKQLFYPMQHAIKKYSGQSYRSFRDSALSFFSGRFNDGAPRPVSPGYRQDEQNPVFDTAGRLIYLKNSVKRITRFIISENGQERKIRTADLMVNRYFSYRNGKIVYSSYRYDPRWTSKAYNEIKLLDVASGKQRKISLKTRYFSPDINEDGSLVVAVNAATSGAVSLDLVNVRTGNVEKKFSWADIVNFSYPKFYGNTIISCVSGPDGKMSVVQIDINSGSFDYLTHPSGSVTGFPLIRDDTLYYSSSGGMNDELYAYTFSDKKTWKIDADGASLGKYHVAVKDDEMVWTTFTSQGQRLQKVSRKNIRFTEVPGAGARLSATGPGLRTVNEDNPGLIFKNEDTTFLSQKYGQLTHPFNFHSMEPLADDPEYSLSLVGENILNTVQSSLTFTYNRSDRSKTAGADILYGGLYPVLSFGYDYSIDRSILLNDQLVYYNLSEPYAGFYIPLNLSRNRSVRGLSFDSSISYTHRSIQKPFRSHYRDASYGILNSYISFSNQVQAASAQVLPRLAQSVYLNYKLPTGRFSGYNYMARGRIYLPGIGLTHSLNFVVAYSQRDTMNQIGFSSGFPYPRGYQSVNLHKMLGVQANYQFPLLYPDAGFANLIYLSRLRSNLFYDHTLISSYSKAQVLIKQNFRSAGAELFFDTRWWNQVEVSFGVRYSRLLDNDLFGRGGRNRLELIMPVNLFNR